MTREEAIRQIESRWSIMDYGESEALGEALDMAIEALSEPSIVRCGECKYRYADKTMYSSGTNETIVTRWSCHRIDGNNDADFCSYGERREP